MLKEAWLSRVLSTSVCDCRETSTASADVTHPEHAKQSVNDIEAGAGFCACTLSSVVTSYGFDSSAFGKVSTGLMHATPGDMKSLRSSAERIAELIPLCNLKWRSAAQLRCL